jgi:hypothetical protein
MTEKLAELFAESATEEHALRRQRLDFRSPSGANAFRESRRGR